MADRNDLDRWAVEALRELGGTASTMEVAKLTWKKHKDELHASGKRFRSWQYDFTWIGKRLRDRGVIDSDASGSESVWVLKEKYPSKEVE